MVPSFYGMYYDIFMILSFCGVKVLKFEDITRALGYLSDQISIIHKTKNPNISGTKNKSSAKHIFYF